MLKEKGGFTLIEMLVVIAMIGILSAVVLTALGPSRDKAKDARIISDVNQARAIAETHYNPTTGAYDIASITGDAQFISSQSDATSNGGALTIISASNGSAFAMYGQLNTKGANGTLQYFCSDSTGVTRQVTSNTTEACPAS